MSRVATVVAVLALLVVVAGVQAATLNVPAQHATIQAAIDAATAGDVINVAAGTYRENIVWATKSLQLIGAGVGQSILNGDVDSDGTGDGSCLRLTGVPTGARIEGFTITAGRAAGTSTLAMGGAIYLENSSPTITNNDISGNVATGGGGAIMSRGTSTPTINSNTFSANTGGSGGAICSEGSTSVPVITNNSFTGNTANSGGGVACTTGSSPTIADNVFTGNVGNWYGGAIDCFNFCNPVIRGNLIQNNSTPSMGGAMRLYRGAQTITNNIITGNTANYGGGIYCDSAQPSLNFNTVAGNSATTYGGGISANQCTLTLANTIIAFNTSPTGGGVRVSGGTTTFSYCDIFGNTAANFSTGITNPIGSNGNIGVDPLFVNAAGGDYHLQSLAGHWTAGGWVYDAASSPCIDAANPAAAWANEPAPNGGRANMGGYGNTAQASRTSDGQTPAVSGVTITPDPAYTNNDLVAVPGAWNDPNGDPEGYIYQWAKWNGTVFVDIVDGTSNTILATETARGDVFRVTCWPTDGTNVGNPVTDQITIDNTVPSITSVTISPDPAAVGQSLTATPAGWSDADGDPEGYDYEWSKWDGGAWVPIVIVPGPGLPSINFLRGDQIQVTCWPNDGLTQGAPVTDTIIIANAAPSITSVAITPDPAYVGQDVTATPAGWSDADGDPEGYDYQWAKWDGAAWQDLVGETTATLAASNFLAGDQLRVTVTPNDGTNTGTPVTAEITIGNSVPSITSVTISPDPATVTDNLLATPAGWSDADGDPEGYDWQWAKWDGAAFVDIVDGTSNTLLVGEFAKGDLLQVTCWPNDGSTQGAPVTDTITIDDTVPTVSAVTIAPDPGRVDADLVATPTGWTDPDGDPETYNWLWEVDSGAGFVTVVGADTGTLPQGNFALGNQVRVTATPVSNGSTGTPVQDVVTIADAKPTVTVTSHANGANIGAVSVLLAGTAADDFGVYQVRVRVNGGLWFDATGTTSWQAWVTLQPGANLIELRARDSAMQWGPVAALTLNGAADLKPTVQITAPAANSVTGAYQVQVLGTAQDDNALARVRVRVNGGTWFDAIGTDNWSAWVTVQSGPNLIEARAQDLAGLWGPIVAVTVTGAVDLKPVALFTAPAEGATVDSVQVLVTGAASDDHAVSRVILRVNGGAWFDATGTNSWSAVVPVITGPMLIEVRARDNVGQWGPIVARTITGVSGDLKPLALITAPADGATVATSPVQVTGTAVDDISVAKVVVRVNGGAWVVATGKANWSASVSLVAGANLIEARAQDSQSQWGPVVGVTVTLNGGAGPAQVAGLVAQPSAIGGQLSFTLSAGGAVTAEVLNIAGRPIRTIVEDRQMPAGLNTLLWDGRSNQGLSVPNGTYLIRLTTRSAEGAQAQGLTTLQVTR